MADQPNFTEVTSRMPSDFELQPLKKKPTRQRQPAPPPARMSETADKLVLEPGRVIKPVIDHEGVKLLVERLYGISVLELTELNGYDDKNYRITEDPCVKNPLLTRSPHGYVLKIMNSMDSKNLAVVEAQNEIMNYLNSRNITAPKPVRNIFGQLYSIETLHGAAHAVRLLQYVPGEPLPRGTTSDQLFYQLGEFVANIDNKLERFNHSGLSGREHIWMLAQVPALDKFKYVIKDAEKLDLVEEVIEEFKYAIVPQYEELEKSVIHGDINEMNLLTETDPKTGKRSITGILDFGDVQYSAVVFELAIAMTYAMLVAGTPRAAAPLLAGYTVNRTLPKHELKLLKTLISARLVQSLVLGAYTLEQDPGNKYVVTTDAQNGWQLLKMIRKTKYSSEEEDPTDWETLATQYLTRS